MAETKQPAQVIQVAAAPAPGAVAPVAVAPVAVAPVAAAPAAVAPVVVTTAPVAATPAPAAAVTTPTTQVLVQAQEPETNYLTSTEEDVEYARDAPGCLATCFQDWMEWCCGLVDEDERARVSNRLKLNGDSKEYEDFSGTIRMRHPPIRIKLPKSRRSLQAMIREAFKARRKVRFAGEGHCSEPHIVSNDVLIMCDKLQHVELDVKEKTVRAEAGLSTNQLVHLLAKNGLVMPSNTIYTSGQMGGLLAAGSHGGGLKYGALADWVISIDIIDGTGKMRRFIRPNSNYAEKGFLQAGYEDKETLVDECKNDTRIWRSVLENLGLFGCIYSVRFEVHDMFNIHWEDKFVPITGHMEPENLKKLVEGHEFIEIFWWPFNDKVELKKYNRTDESLSLCPCCSNCTCWECLISPFCCGRDNWKVRWMADMRDMRKSWDAITAAVGGKVLATLPDNPQRTKQLTKLIPTFMPSQDRVTIATEGMHFNNYIPSMKIWFLEVAFLISPDYVNVSEMFNFIRETTDRYASEGKFPFNMALELRFAGAGSPLLYHGHVKDFQPLPDMRRVVPQPMEEYLKENPNRTKVCYFEIVTMAKTPNWFEFATEICKKAMSIPGGYGRPHWGKWFPHNDAEVVKTMHEHIRAQGNGVVEMLRVREQLNMDPHNLFVNPYLKTRVIDPALALERGEPIPAMPEIPYDNGAQQGPVALRNE